MGEGKLEDPPDTVPANKDIMKLAKSLQIHNIKIHGNILSYENKCLNYNPD